MRIRGVQGVLAQLFEYLSNVIDRTVQQVQFNAILVEFKDELVEYCTGRWISLEQTRQKVDPILEIVLT